MAEHSCPVCRKGIAPCDHMLDGPFYDAAFEQAFAVLRSNATNPVDAGVARFAAEAIAFKALATRHG